VSGRPEQRPTGLPRELERHLWWRSLALQAAWNHQRMQNLGLLHVLAPWSYRRQLDPDQRRLLARRHLGYFNTNPYLAPFILGGLVRLEDEHLDGGPVSEHLIAGFRDSLSRACGALGDELVWLGARPATVLLAALAGWLVAWPWALAVMALAAGAQLSLRRWALRVGFARGLDVLQVLERPGWHRAAGWAGRAALGLTGLLSGLFFARGVSTGAGPAPWLLVLVIVVGLTVAVVAGQRRSAELQFLLGLALLAGLSLVV